MKKKEIHSLHVASWRERQKKGPPPPRSEQYLRQTEWKDRGNGTDSRGIFLDQPFGTVIGFPPSSLHVASFRPITRKRPAQPRRYNGGKIDLSALRGSPVEKIRGRWKKSRRSSMEQNVNAIFHRCSETVAKRRETIDIHLIPFAVSTFDPSSPSSSFFPPRFWGTARHRACLCKRIGWLGAGVRDVNARKLNACGSLSWREWHARWPGMASIVKLARLTGASIVFFFSFLWRIVLVFFPYARDW